MSLLSARLLRVVRSPSGDAYVVFFTPFIAPPVPTHRNRWILFYYKGHFVNDKILCLLLRTAAHVSAQPKIPFSQCILVIWNPRVIASLILTSSCVCFSVVVTFFAVFRERDPAVLRYWPTLPCLYPPSFFLVNLQQLHDRNKFHRKTPSESYAYPHSFVPLIRVVGGSSFSRAFS